MAILRRSRARTTDLMRPTSHAAKWRTLKTQMGLKQCRRSQCSTGQDNSSRLSYNAGYFLRPYFAVKLALRSVFAWIMKPVSAAVASAGRSSLPALSAYTVKI
jgi:hypothetical protein